MGRLAARVILGRDEDLPDLRAPEPDARAVAGHHPDRFALVPALHHRQPEDARVERLGRIEIDDLEDELVDAGDRDTGQASAPSIAASASGTAISSRRMNTIATSRAAAPTRVTTQNPR